MTIICMYTVTVIDDALYVHVYPVIDGAEAVVTRLNQVTGADIEVQTTPLRQYESFARDVLKVDPALCEPWDGDITPSGNEVVFYTKTRFNYQVTFYPLHCNIPTVVHVVVVIVLPFRVILFFN